MLALRIAAALGPVTDGNAVVLSGCCGNRKANQGPISKSEPVNATSTADSERILADFTKLYVGPAHGIDKAELEAVEGGSQRIVVFVYDWNGILNIPSRYQGMKVAFTQFVPTGGIWQV